MSGVTIRNPGDARQAFVSPDGQLLTQSEILPLQHFISRYRGQSYQAIGTHSIGSSGSKVVLHTRNDSPTLSMVISYIRVQALGLSGGTTALANSANYWTLGFGRTYTSGGDSVVPVNMNRASGALADATVYGNNPTLAGSATEFDRLYQKDTGQERFSKDGSIILGPRDTMEISFVTDNTAGTLYSRITFMLMDLSDRR